MPDRPEHIDLDFFSGASPEAADSRLDDIPELTEVVEAHEFPARAAFSSRNMSPPPPNPGVEAAQQALTEAGVGMTAELAAALSAAVHVRLNAEIPTLIEATLQSAFPAIARELRQGMSEVVADAIKDFLARQNKR